MDSLTGQLGYTVHMGCGVCTMDGYGQLNRPTWLYCPYGLWGVHNGWLWTVTQCLLPTRLIHFSASNHLRSFVWENSCVLFLLHFKTSLSDMAETELRVSQALEKPFIIAIFPYTDSWCLVPFGSNISWDTMHKVFLVLTLQR
jgi:hypothetical protein